jgi:hypothetical protein
LLRALDLLACFADGALGGRRAAPVKEVESKFFAPALREHRYDVLGDRVLLWLESGQRAFDGAR